MSNLSARVVDCWRTVDELLVLEADFVAGGGEVEVVEGWEAVEFCCVRVVDRCAGAIATAVAL